MRRHLSPALLAVLTLTGCGQETCNNLPICLDPAVYCANHEVQADGELTGGLVRLARGHSVKLTATLNRHGLPETLPVSFVLTSLESSSGTAVPQPERYYTPSATTLWEGGGLKVTASMNPVVGNTVELTFSLAPEATLELFSLQFIMKKSGTQCQSGGSLFAAVVVTPP